MPGDTACANYSPHCFALCSVKKKLEDTKTDIEEINKKRKLEQAPHSTALSVATVCDRDMFHRRRPG